MRILASELKVLISRALRVATARRYAEGQSCVSAAIRSSKWVETEIVTYKIGFVILSSSPL